MSKARELAALGNAYSDGALSNRNLIINGAMQVWQRGTSFTGYNNYSADRWRVSVSAVPTSNTVDRVQDGNKNYARWQCTMGSGQLAFLHQRVEGNPLAGKTVTVSFSAKGTGTLSEISFDQITGGVSSQVVAATNVVLSATETRYSFTVNLPSIASVPLSTDQTRVRFFCHGSTSSVDLYLTEVQLEVGDTATPFEHRSYGQELALCQRYYSEINIPSHVGQNGGNISGGYSVYTSMFFPFKEKMRAAPTIIQPLSLTTDVTGTVTHTASVDGYVLKHGNTTALYTYIDGMAKFNAEL